LGSGEVRGVEIVADASIVIHLSATGRFYLLKKLFKEIAIPEGVYTEVVVEGWGLSGSLETSEAIRVGFIKVNQVMDKGKVKQVSREHKISTSNAELALVGEEEVREAAEATGFGVRGCLGIVMEAVKNKIIFSRQAIQDVDNLVESGYRISDDIVRAAKDALRR
jgi:hypothetical protein